MLAATLKSPPINYDIKCCLQRALFDVREIYNCREEIYAPSPPLAYFEN